MFGQKENGAPRPSQDPQPAKTPGALLTVGGDYARIEGTFEIADSLEVECEIGGELNVKGRLTIGENGAVNANVRTVDAVIRGSYEGNMIATGNVEIAATGRVSGNITTDSLVISKGGFFNGSVARITEEDKKEGRRIMVGDDEAKTPAQQPTGQQATPRGATTVEKATLEKVLPNSRNV